MSGPTRSVKPAWAVAFKRRREEAVGSQEELAARADISQSLISQIERGVQTPTGLSVERFSRILDALNWSAGEFAQATGLDVPGSDMQPPAPRPRPIPDALAQMIDEKAALAPELATDRWQQYLAGQRFKTGSATPDQWWNLFLVIKNAGVEPGGN